MPISMLFDSDYVKYVYPSKLCRWVSLRQMLVTLGSFLILRIFQVSTGRHSLGDIHLFGQTLIEFKILRRILSTGFVSSDPPFGFWADRHFVQIPVQLVLSWLLQILFTQILQTIPQAAII